MAGKDPELTVLESKPPLITGWRHESAYGGMWELRFEATPARERGPYSVKAMLISAG